jgi:predicted ATPase/class 3 adenylate cyclase/DNA-binding SARP family transcriptional activator
MATGAFIGRAGELDRLGRALDAAAAGAGSTVLVAGEAGIGKTRLAVELATRARGAGFELLLGRCVDLIGTELAYQPFVEALRELPVLPAEASGSQQRVFADTLALLAERASASPVLLVLEDLHWADTSTLDLVVFLAHNLDDQRVLLVATYRADEPTSAERLRRLAEGVRRSGSALQVELGPLEREELTALLVSRAADTPPTTALTEAIVTRSEGNPFFAEELLAAAGERGVELPGGLRELLLERIARLDGTTRELLRLAAAAGRDVGYPLLRAAAELPERDLHESLRDAVEHGILVTDPETNCFRFRHALLAEAIYATLLPGEREQVHGRLAEELGRGEPQASPAELAPHWEAAGRAPEAIAASVEAARESEAVHGLAEALAHLERALRLWDAVPDAAERAGSDLADLCSRAAELAVQTGGAPRSVELMRRAIELVGEDDDPVRAALLYERLGRYLHASGNSAAAVAARERAVELVPAQPPSPERAQVLAALANILMVSWRPEESLPICEQALALARTVGARSAEFTALATLGIILAYTGRAEEGLAQLRRALALAEEARHGRNVDYIYTELTETLTMLGRPRESARLAVKALEVAEGYGLEANHLVANRVEALVAMGEWDEADSVSAAALRASSVNYPHRPLLARAELEVGRGDFDAARAHLEAALATARGDSSLLTYDAFVAELALWEHRWTDAWSSVRNGLARAHAPAAAQIRVRLCAHGLRAQAELAGLARARGDGDAARLQLGEARELLAAARRAAPEAAQVTANAAGWSAQAEAEHERALGRARPDTWARAVALWEQVERPPLAAYCRWRQAEALVAAGATRADVAVPLEEAHAVAGRIGARPLLRELELLAERAGLELVLPDAASARAEREPEERLDEHENGVAREPNVWATASSAKRGSRAGARADFRILGPLEVRDGDREVRLGGGKQRALLALLLVNANRTLAIDSIVDGLWGEDVPETAPKMVQIYVSKLRRVLAPGTLHTRPPGYALRLEPDELDLQRFERLVADARASLEAGRAEQASAGLREALELWRGPALAEFASEPFATAEAARLEELRISALEGRLEADLRLGRHADLVGELESLIARFPLREGLRQQHMLALYRSGRQAEALAAYQEARQALAGELGIEPSPALRELERRILQQDSSLDLAESAAPSATAADPAPARTSFRVTTACASCGAESPVGTRFCPSCGAALGEAQEEMLKLVTVLFADIVGSTAWAEPLHAEDARDLMADYFAAMAAEIRAEGGTIEKYVGDAIMAVFGVPTVHEDDAVRAVRAAWRMLERLRSWNEGRDAGHALEIRIGLSTGEVLASGAEGADLRITGDAVNLAARLEQAAKPGTVVVADRTARSVRSHFELRPVDEPIGTKGRNEALGAWLVEAHRSPEESRGAPGISMPLVGRDQELSVLRTAFDHACREGRPALVTVIGDAGVGKSRVVREFLSLVEGEAKVLIGRCLSYGQGVTLWPLGEMLKAQAGVHETDASGEAFAKIARVVDACIEPALAGHQARTAAALASTLGLLPPDDPLGSLDPRERYRELVEAWRALLASLARRAPVVAVVEDLHWADPTMLDVLDELAERLDGPIFFLCTARPDLLGIRPDWGGGRRSFSSLPLDPLGSDESARLVSLLPGVGELPEDVRRRILERAGGNPFFLEEIVRHLIDEGFLVWERERWQARTGIDRIEIPDNVQAVLLARLDLLAPDERRVAQRGAVVGRVFWDGAVAGLVDVQDLDAALRTLRRREFVVERLSSSIPGQREYMFKHVLVRDVAYESLTRAERGRAHATTASWIEQTSGERTGELAEVLAHHYDAAFSFLRDDDFRQRARAYLVTAAGNAHRRFAVQQGDRLARRAVELSEPGGERVEALEALGDLHYLAFLGDAAWRTYGEALAELSDDDPAYARLAGKASMFAARWIGTVQELPGVDAVRGVIERGLRAAPPHSPERAQLLVNRGFLVVQRERRPDDEADAAVREAATAAKDLGDADLLSAALDLVQTHAQERGRYGEAHRTALRRVELVSRLADVKEIGDTYAVAARTAHHLGRFREAEGHATACIERARGIDSGSYLHGLAWRIATRFALGEWEGALADQAELERVAALAPQDLPPSYAMGAYTRVSLCHELRADLDSADRYIEVGLRYSKARRHLFTNSTSMHLAPLARTLARRGRFDEALALVPLVPGSTAAGMTLEALCEIAGMQERWDEAPSLVAAAREESEVGELLALPSYADRLAGRAAAASGDLEEAVRLLARSADGFAAIEARWEEAWSRLLLAGTLAGDTARAEPELVAALAVFERLGSVREVERARVLLAEVAV